MPVVFTWHPGNVYVIKNIHTKICGNFHIEHKSLLFFFITKEVFPYSNSDETNPSSVVAGNQHPQKAIRSS